MSLEPHNHDDASSSSSMNLASSSSSDSSIGDTREFVVYERDLLLHLSSSPRVQDAQRSLPLAPLKQWYSELLADPNHVAHNANVHQGGAGRESGGHHPRQNRRQARNEEHDGHHHRGLQPMGDFRAEGARPRRGHHQQHPSLTNVSASLTSPPPSLPPQAANREDNNNNNNNGGGGTESKPTRRPNNPTSRSDTGPWRPSRFQQQQQAAAAAAAEEHQPAWMADSSNDAPGHSSTEHSPAWMSFPADAKKDAGLSMDKGGHVDEIQAFKAQMRERERREKGLPPSSTSSADTPAPSSSTAVPLNDPALLSQTRPAAQDAILPAATSVASDSAHRDALMDAAPRGSRFARLFNKQQPSSEPSAPAAPPQESAGAAKPAQAGDDDVKDFMSALLNNKPQQQAAAAAGAPPSAALGLGSASMPSSSTTAAARPTAQATPKGQSGDSDMARVMQMLQSSVALSPDPSASARASPVSSFEQPRQSRHAFARGGGSSAGASTRATPQPQPQPQPQPPSSVPPPPPPGMLNDAAIMSQQRPTPPASAQSSRRPPSMQARDFVMNQGPPASPNMDPLMSMMMSNASGAPSRAVSGGPHSLPGLMNMSGPPANSSSTPASSGSMGAPPRFAQASSAPNGAGMSAGEPAPPRMQQQQQQQRQFPGGFGMPPPRQPGFPGAPHLPGAGGAAGPPGPPSRGGSMSSPMNMYDMSSSMGFIPPGLPGAAGIPPPPPQQQQHHQHQRGMPLPPPPAQMMPPFPPYSMQQLNGGGPPPPGALPGMNHLPPMHQHMLGRGGPPAAAAAAGGGGGAPPSASPDLMALFAAHSGGGGGVSASPTQFR